MGRGLGQKATADGGGAAAGWKGRTVSGGNCSCGKGLWDADGRPPNGLVVARDVRRRAHNALVCPGVYLDGKGLVGL